MTAAYDILAFSFISQPEENLVTCLAHLEYRGLHCIVLQLLDTNIRQVVIILIVFRKALKNLFCLAWSIAHNHRFFQIAHLSLT